MSEDEKIIQGFDDDDDDDFDSYFDNYTVSDALRAEINNVIKALNEEDYPDGYDIHAYWDDEMNAIVVEALPTYGDFPEDDGFSYEYIADYVFKNSKLTCESMSGGFTENGLSYSYNYPEFKEGYPKFMEGYGA